MLNSYHSFDYRMLLSFAFSKNYLSLLKLHQATTPSLQDVTPSRFNTTLIVMDG